MRRCALISVSDKSQLDLFGPGLEDLGWTIISTGGTATALRSAGCSVTEVADYTGFPEILDGRVKTLHPHIFAGILAAPTADHRQILDRLGIAEVDLVVVNLYPFRETVAGPGVTAAKAVEQIDIGGPALLRAAAKNHGRVTVVVDPDDYLPVLQELEQGATAAETRRQLAVKAFRHTAAYDAAIAAHLPGLLEPRGEADNGSLDQLRTRPAAAVAETLLQAEEVILRYGENPHQQGLLARTMPPAGLAGARQVQGKALSYNNLGDASGAWRLVWDLAGPGVAIIKHANPCGVGLHDSMEQAFRLARATDPLSAFGGVIAANRMVDRAMAEAVIEQFAEVVIAPAYDDGALEVLRAKKNLRVLAADPPVTAGYSVRSIDGGFLLQSWDSSWDGEERETASERQPTMDELQALETVWRVVKHVGSNAIVIGTGDRILGIGAGQMSRVDAARIAVAKAQEQGHDLRSAVAASDAFFPFADGIEALHEAGVTAVIQPGGSIRDKDVVAACDRLGMAMVLTRRRHFKH